MSRPFEDEWTLVALLSPGAALESARINGAPVQLVQRAEGLFWLAEKRQKATVHLTYHVDSRFRQTAPTSPAFRYPKPQQPAFHYRSHKPI